ncbi:glutamyl-tRNA amidotransferase [Avibacterium sp. 20-15]|uniref:allophanate hydrolase-related protein n=1 Tax=unclassified Avibacterium TaxID=2685287 RepID=UPI0020264A6E|nr:MULTISPECIES: glutamyl-tRNA amidotransferase [unclassified Avibacterium]MCW9732951.1 glutamyl-tRNA amidotransferase [Avibacterium sp. 20-15]URL05085.1 glutamyl-tRNA amidotransferase [Avibacterium sp. 20-132]
MNEHILFAVNGTLMRGLALNHNLLNVGAKFIREDKTDEYYRLWSINDIHPAMQRTREKSYSVELEIWAINPTALATILLNEPNGLTIGKVHLTNGEQVLGVLGENWLTQGQIEISHTGGWRNYLSQRQNNHKERHYDK